MTKEAKIFEIAIGWDVGGWSGRNHGLAVLHATNEKVTILQREKLSLPKLKKQLNLIIEKYRKDCPITIGIDAPLQFPDAFQKMIANNQDIAVEQALQGARANPLAWRATDLFFKKTFQKTPLSPSFSFLTSNTTVAMAVLQQLKKKYSELSVLPFDEEREINCMETYPGLLKSKTFQSSGSFLQLKELLHSAVMKGIPGFDYYFKEGTDKNDVADALICALFALGFHKRNSSIPEIEKNIPRELRQIAKREGWIYYPKNY